MTIRSHEQRGLGKGDQPYHDCSVATAQDTRRHSRTSVLLVDDDPAFLQVEALFLEMHYRDEIDVVGTAGNGEECFARAQRLVPEVILIDLNMPGLSGLRTIPLLRIMFPETRIIALTLDDDEAARRAVLAAGGKHLVSKATMNTDLMPAIRRAMNHDPLQSD